MTTQVSVHDYISGCIYTLSYGDLIITFLLALFDFLDIITSNSKYALNLIDYAGDERHDVYMAAVLLLVIRIIIIMQVIL
jgi:hypothetical protein